MGRAWSHHEAAWSSGVAGVFWVYCNKPIFKDPFGHIMAFTTEEHYIIWIRSYMCRRVQTHKPVWELRTSTAPPPSLLFSVASTANLVEHNIFTSFVDRHKNTEAPENGIPPSDRATRRYTEVHLDFCLRFSTLIGQIGRVPLFGAGRRRYMSCLLYTSDAADE